MTWDFIKQLLFTSTDASPVLTVAYWGILAALVGAEFFVPQLQNQERASRWPANFGLGLINMALVPLVPVSALWAAEWAHHEGFGLLNLLTGSWWPIAAIATIAIQSLAGYAFHLLSHKVPWLWRLHRVHHFDLVVDVSTGVRHHPLEMLAALLIDVPVAIIFGLLPWALIVFGIVEELFALFTHANIRLPSRLDRAARLFLVTPRVHAVHHSSYRPETDSNFGTVFIVWDRLFGTYSDLRADRPEQIQFGLGELQDQRASDLWWQLKSPALLISTRAPSVSVAQLSNNSQDDLSTSLSITQDPQP